MYTSLLSESKLIACSSEEKPQQTNKQSLHPPQKEKKSSKVYSGKGVGTIPKAYLRGGPDTCGPEKEPSGEQKAQAMKESETHVALGSGQRLPTCLMSM